MCTLTALLLTKKNKRAYLLGGSRYCSVILITLTLVAKELELGTRFSPGLHSVAKIRWHNFIAI